MKTGLKRATRGTVGKNAFTLAEIVITMAVSSILLTTLGTSTMMLMKSNLSLNYEASMNVQRDKAIGTFTNDAQGAKELSSLSASEVRFYIPVTAPDTLIVSYREVGYRFDTGSRTFYREVRDPLTNTTAEFLEMDGIEYFKFSFFNSQGEETSNALDAKKIEWEAVLSRGEDAFTKAFLDLSTTIFLRNKTVSN